MRVTDTRLMQIAADGMSAAMEKMGSATTALSSGYRVTVPSQDGVAWRAAMRTTNESTASQARGSAIANAQDTLNLAETAIGSVSDLLQKANQIAVQQANDTYSATDRRSAAGAIDGLREEIRGQLNLQTSDGSYVFAGSQGTTAPFDASGVYHGDTSTRSIEVSQGQQETVTVAGSAFTAANGVDILGTLSTLSSALDANDPVAIGKSIQSIQGGITQVSSARSQIGYALGALDQANSARASLELQLQATESRLVDVDSISAVSDLANAKTNFDAASAVAQQIIQLGSGKAFGA